MPRSKATISFSQVRVGLFVLIAIGVLIFLVLNASGDINPFSRKLHLKARFVDANGLREGSEVRLAGVRVGKVERIVLLEPSPVPNAPRVEAQMTIDALDGRAEFGFNFDPSHLHWQGVDPVEFIRAFPNRIYHVHIKDVALSLNGKSSVLGSYLPYGDPRRGWDFRSPGHGGIDWEGLIRALNDIGYDGPLSVEWKDAGMNREYGAEDACKFVKRLDFERAPRANEAFQ